MKKFVAAIVSASILAASLAPAQAGMSGMSGLKTAAVAPAQSESLIRKTRIRSSHVALGIVLGLSAAALAAESAKHQARLCRKWSRRCDRGNERACWNYDTKC
ncbi:MAG: hypothetical protein OEM91_16520 [Hyphomicrobiales bacterium]|nr:hypothetical protein [Hyphomicrobiales bacterium]